ncbi:hypothetical protein [Achromobacter mucicolens]|jgi:hypothetical protein|uniref:hypothetical protein n=1 Tax=Achromobacter mucicolens TaxID=1389922 RepID=UPI001581A24C|nr:hypothetical protein [Achromobacter mucicolens]
MANLLQGNVAPVQAGIGSITGSPDARLNRLFFARCMRGGNVTAAFRLALMTAQAA